MSLSHKLIKRDQVDISGGFLKIPVSPIELKMEREGEHNPNRHIGEEIRRTKASMDKLIREAERKARSLIAGAEEEVRFLKEEAKEAGYREGYENGYQAGYEESLKEVEEIKENAKALLKEAHRQSREYIDRTGHEIIELAAAIAEKILHYQIDIQEESLVRMSREVLKQSSEKEQVIIRCPEKYIPVFKVHSSQLENVCPNAKFVFIEDSSVQEPGCIIETDKQVINLEINHQLDNIIKALKGMDL